MRLLVIGRSGQLAQCLAELERDSGITITCSGPPDADLTLPDTLARAIDTHGPDVVLNAGAYTAVDNAESEPDAARALNADGPGHLARLCARNGVPLIHVSTDYVFDGTKTEPYTEADPTRPLGVYGETKRAGEIAVQEAHSKHLIARTAWVFSPHAHNFFKTMLRLAGERDTLSVVDDQRGSPTYAPHLAEALVAMAERVVADGSFADWGIVNVAGAGETTWCGLAREVFACSERHGGPHATVKAITTADYPTPAARPANSRLDLTKLERVFSRTMPRWQEGVADCVDRLVGAETSKTIS